MPSVHIKALALCAGIALPFAARGQGTTQVYLGYNAVPPSLTSGQSFPINGDKNGNLNVDCVVGCTGGSAGTSTAAQGAPAVVTQAWPVLNIYQNPNGANVPVSSTAPLPTQETSTAITGATMPAGGTGVIGWLSAIWARLGGLLTVADTNSANYSLWPTIAATNGVYTPPAGYRALGALCTVAGNLTLTDTAGNTQTYPLPVGFSVLVFKPVSFTSAATATFYGDQ